MRVCWFGLGFMVGVYDGEAGNQPSQNRPLLRFKGGGGGESERGEEGTPQDKA